MKNENILKNIGLNNIASKIYLFLLNNKKATILNIARNTKIARTSVYSNIELLKEWGLVGQAIEGKTKYFYPESPNNLINVVQIREKLAKQAAAKLLPHFEKDKIENKIKFGYGKEDFKQFANNIISGDEKDILQFINTSSLFECQNKKFLEEIREKRKKQGIKARILTAHKDKEKTRETITDIDNIEHLREIKFLPPNIKLEISFVMFRNKVQFFGPPQENFVFEFQSQAFKDTMNSIFNFLWEISEEF